MEKEARAWTLAPVWGYLRENPLRAGLVNDESAYMWSSANPHLEFEFDEA
jgi:hypothetical protein